MGYEDATIALAKRYKKENDRLRAELASRQIDIDTFREGNQKLRAELANARLERDNIASLNSSLIAKDGIIANLNERSAQYERDSVAKDARIAELETDHLFAENKRLREACQEFRARAERAELEARKIDLELGHYKPLVTELRARAALAPSPVLIDDLGQVWPEDAPAEREG